MFSYRDSIANVSTNWSKLRGKNDFERVDFDFSISA